MRRIVRTISLPFMLAVLLAVALAGCGSGSAPPSTLTAAPPLQSMAERDLPEIYRLQVGDQISVLVLDEDELSTTVTVMPDGKITAPGVGEVMAAGSTLSELAEELRVRLRRIIRYPDVSLMLADYTDLQVYVFGEVRVPGAQPYVHNMTTLHALSAAAGGNDRAKLGSVVILRRTGPTEMEVYRVNLSDAMDGKAQARDLFLQPYDVVYVPRTVIGNINLFVDQFVRQNIAPITAYIEGWRAFHVRDWKSYEVR